MSSRSVYKIVQTIKTLEGAGFTVRRPFPTRSLSQIDPFLMVDHFGPIKYAPGEAKGAPNHPHRGFETVSYLIEGSMQHKDSNGNSGTLKSGDCQWMTAGAGIVHDEMPSEEIMKNGGTLHGFQIWINLPAKHKMIAPRYQEIPCEKIPTVVKDGVKVKVIAGESLGANAVIETKTPIMYLHFTLQPGKEHIQVVPENYNAFAYVIKGKGYFGKEDKEAQEGQLVWFDKGTKETSTVKFRAADNEECDFLCLGGVPINEPIARYGPFVMNHDHEIEQAFLDYHSGKMGKINFDK